MISICLSKAAFYGPMCLFSFIRIYKVLLCNSFFNLFEKLIYCCMLYSAGFICNAFLPLVCQVAEPQVSRLCREAEEFIATGKWLELASLMVTSAELIFSKVSDKGRMHFLFDVCALHLKF